MSNGIKYTTKQFIDKSKTIHNNKYDYSLVEYKNSHTKIRIICPFHKEFEQLPYHHLSGHGCKKCSDKQNGYNKRLTKDSFINKSNLIHKNKYAYSLVNYINAHTKVKIICSKHGIFEQTPNAHVNKKQGCPSCSGNKKMTTKEFIKHAIKIHDNKYDYSLVEYKNNRIKVKIICKEHGVFEQNPTDHLRPCGCPKCNESKNEKKIKELLEQKQIKFETQKTFDGCLYKRKLKFDFYLPDCDTCIEYDGEQHFVKYRFEKDNNKLRVRQKRDKIKTDYCKDNNIKLIRIKYNDNINEKLNILKQKKGYQK